MGPSSHRHRIEPRQLLLAVVAFAFTQLLIAGHQFQHDLDSNPDTCATCVQVAEPDAPPAEAGDTFILPTYAAHIAIVRPAVTASPAYRANAPRAPPFA